MFPATFMPTGAHLSKGHIAALMLAVLLMSGCGQKGALYLPDGDQPEVQAKDLPGEEIRLDRSGDAIQEDATLLDVAPAEVVDEEEGEDDPDGPPPGQ